MPHIGYVGYRVLGYGSLIMETQKEKNMENYLETGGIWGFHEVFTQYSNLVQVPEQ